MNRVIITLEPELAEKLRQAAASEGVSQGEWAARLIAERLGAQWPEEVRKLAGSWPDAPEAETLRQGEGKDVPREPL